MTRSALPSPTHACPGGCGTHVPRHRLACRSCWFRLPTGLRRAIWQHHESGNTVAHGEAVAAAIGWFRANPRRCACPAPDPNGRQAVAAGCPAHGVPSIADADTETRPPARPDHREESKVESLADEVVLRLDPPPPGLAETTRMTVQHQLSADQVAELAIVAQDIAEDAAADHYLGGL